MWWCWDRSKEPLGSPRPALYSSAIWPLRPPGLQAQAAIASALGSTARSNGSTLARPLPYTRLLNAMCECHWPALALACKNVTVAECWFCIVAETTDAALPYGQSRSRQTRDCPAQEAPVTVCGPGLSRVYPVSLSVYNRQRPTTPSSASTRFVSVKLCLEPRDERHAGFDETATIHSRVYMPRVSVGNILWNYKTS